NPETVDAELGQVVEPLGQSGEVADAVAVAVHERLDVDLVEDGVLVPVARGGHCNGARGAGAISGWPMTRRDPAPFPISLLIPPGAASPARSVGGLLSARVASSPPLHEVALVPLEGLAHSVQIG